ncbi:hypothetical protein [Fictibacillus barbaricus]|uniref:Uncharacterized protein n=1 Tax=Fictibacillus barbaricus TaxID=182136 RepID=A0ABU1U2Y0_9BACL|nr:hypothetical protein [Fictibacillus barbaricus]MDR7073839.1 hypothetical protein [Fictibacillus barbaricus]
MKRTDFFNIALFGILWVWLIQKKPAVHDWLLHITNNHLIVGIIIPIILYAVMIIGIRVLKNKYL